MERKQLREYLTAEGAEWVGKHIDIDLGREVRIAMKRLHSHPAWARGAIVEFTVFKYGEGLDDWFQVPSAFVEVKDLSKRADIKTCRRMGCYPFE